MVDKYFPEAYQNATAAMTGSKPPSGRSWVSEFENMVADRFGVKFAIATNSGTSAIHAALLALGIGPNDEVISPGLTVVMDAFATRFCGASPVFADVDPLSWNIDPIDVRRKITKRTKAVIVVSWFGVPVDMAPFWEIAEEYGVFLIDDSAETLGVRNCRGKYSGTDAHMGIYSFEEKKHLTTGGEGGMLVTDDEELAQAARRFAGLGYGHLTASTGRTSLDSAVFQMPDYARFTQIGLNYRMTPVAAAIGAGQFQNLDEILSKRKQSAELLLDAARDCSWLVPQQVSPASQHAYYTMGFEYRGFEQLGLPWRDFYSAFVNAGGDGFYANCLNPFREPVFEADKGLKVRVKQAEATCPVAIGLQSRIMAFKTNYLDMRIAEEQADTLRQLIGRLESE